MKFEMMELEVLVGDTNETWIFHHDVLLMLSSTQLAHSEQVS